MTWLAAAALLVSAAIAAAHPLGNFSTNRYAALNVEPQAVRVAYVVDMAELPAEREVGAIDTNRDGAVDAAERDAWSTRRAAELARDLELVHDGRRLALEPLAATLSVEPGAEGLPTLRFEVTYHAPLPGPRGELTFRDRTFAGRPGWQEIVAMAADGVELRDATVPARDASRMLRAYPDDLLQAPLRVRDARMGLAPAPVPAPAPRPGLALEQALAILGLGFVLGLRHALDADHVAAVSTLVSRDRSLLGSSMVGAAWGAGHTTALLGVGAAVILLQGGIPPALVQAFEAAVAAMLVALGASLLRTLWTGGPLDARVHDPGAATAGRPHPVGRARPFLVGAVHGLAGSGALMLAVLTTIPSRSLAVAYLAVFGIGSLIGMTAMSTVLGVPLALASERFRRIDLGLRAAAGIGSVVVGLLLAWRIGVETGVLA